MRDTIAMLCIGALCVTLVSLFFYSIGEAVRKEREAVQACVQSGGKPVRGIGDFAVVCVR